jgi:hypothetical protein
MVLDTLKDFTQKIDHLDPSDRLHLFQYLIESICYGQDETGVDVFYPKRGMSFNNSVSH